jgi:hypothetical protein
MFFNGPIFCSCLVSVFSEDKVTQFLLEKYNSCVSLSFLVDEGRRLSGIHTQDLLLTYLSENYMEIPYKSYMIIPLIKKLFCKIYYMIQKKIL